MRGGDTMVEKTLHSIFCIILINGISMATPYQRVIDINPWCLKGGTAGTGDSGRIWYLMFIITTIRVGYIQSSIISIRSPEQYHHFRMRLHRHFSGKVQAVDRYLSIIKHRPRVNILCRISYNLIFNTIVINIARKHYFRQKISKIGLISDTDIILIRTLRF